MNIMSFRDFLLIVTFVIGCSILTLLMFLPTMAEIEQENQFTTSMPETDLPLNSSDFIGKWSLVAFGNIQSQYVFTSNYVTIIDGKKTITTQWTFSNSTKTLSVQYDTGWINYYNCNKLNIKAIQFTRNNYVYELRGI